MTVAGHLGGAAGRLLPTEEVRIRGAHRWFRHEAGKHWYATTLDRVKAVRRTLRKWDSIPAVRALDEGSYDWHTTVISVSAQLSSVTMPTNSDRLATCQSDRSATSYRSR